MVDAVPGRHARRQGARHAQDGNPNPNPDPNPDPYPNPNPNPNQAEGVYDQSIVIRSTMKIWKDWPGNIAIEIDFTRMSIAESPTIEPAKEDQPDDPPTPW